MHNDSITITDQCLLLICIYNDCICVGLYPNPSSSPCSRPRIKSVHSNQLIQPLSEVEQSDRLSHEEELVQSIPSSNTISQSSPLSSPSFLSLPIECGGTRIFIP